MKQLEEKYRDRDVAFLTVYVREAHPGERGYQEYAQPPDFDHKLANARALVAKEAITRPVLVDGMDEAVHRRYGSLPNMVYVIDKAGTIAYKATWTLADEIDGVLAELTAGEAAPAPACGWRDGGRRHGPEVPRGAPLVEPDVRELVPGRAASTSTL